MKKMPCRPFSLCGFFTALTLCALGASSVSAAPADEIRRAVLAGGAAQVQTATQAQFVKAFSAVLARVDQQKHPEYVTSAIKLRADFAPQITVAALRAHRRPSNDAAEPCNWVDPIIRAAIAAAPAAKDMIVRAAVQSELHLRECILAAAGASVKDYMVDAGSGKDSTIGTINPANLSALGNVVSRSQP